MPDGIRCFFFGLSRLRSIRPLARGYLACARYARLRVAISLALDTPRGAVAHLLDDAKLRSVLKFDAVDDGVAVFGEVLPELITLLGASFMHRSAVRGLIKP